LTAFVTSHSANRPGWRADTRRDGEQRRQQDPGCPSSSVNAGEVRTCRPSVVPALTRRRRIARAGWPPMPCTRKRSSVRLMPPATSTVLRPFASGSDSGARVVSAAIVATACTGAAEARAASSVAPAMVQQRVLEASMPSMAPPSKGWRAIASAFTARSQRAVRRVAARP